MSWYILLLEFIGIVAMGDAVLGFLGVIYSLIKNSKKFDFFFKVTVCSLIVCVVSFLLILYFKAK